MEKFTYSGSNKILLRIAHLLNRKAPLPLDGNGDPDWGSVGQVLTTDGAGNTSWGAGGGGGGDTVSYTPTLQSGTQTGTITINGTAQAMYAPTPPTKTSDLQNDSNFVADANYVHTDTNYTAADASKLSGIAAGAEVNVQSDWNQADSTADDYIKNKPSIPAAQIQSDWTQADNTQADYIKNKPSLATVATSGLYSDLSGTPTIPTALADLSEDTTHRVVTDTEKSTWNGKVSDNPTFTEATTRANIASGESFATILGKIKKFFTDLKTVAFSGSYNDLSDKPTIPTVNDGTLTIQQNGTTVGTFSANQSGDTTVNLTGGGGSGGHTIEDTSGADLHQRENLQFVGVYTEDDSDHDRTKVNIVRPMTKAAMEALSSAEKEGFIDTTDEDDDYIPISAEDVKYGNTDVDSALDDIYSRISGGSRTVTTLVDETANIAAGASKQYATLTSTALLAYDEVVVMIGYSNQMVNAVITKVEMTKLVNYSSGGITGATMCQFGRLLISGGSITVDYSFGVRPLAAGMYLYNRSTTTSIDSVLIEGITY